MFDDEQFRKAFLMFGVYISAGSIRVSLLVSNTLVSGVKAMCPWDP